jgi:hypothetical protein
LPTLFFKLYEYKLPTIGAVTMKACTFSMAAGYKETNIISSSTTWHSIVGVAVD